MSDASRLDASQRQFSLGFRRMANLVAIQSTGNPERTLDEVVLQCFLVEGEPAPADARGVRAAIKAAYGLRPPTHEIQSSLDRLESAGRLTQPSGSEFVVPHDIRQLVKERIDRAIELEDYVKRGWRIEIQKLWPDLSFKDLWDSLQDYLRMAFQQHGVQTVALLDPTIASDAMQVEALTPLLVNVIERRFDAALQSQARAAVSNFLGDIGGHPDRAKYLAQLADGTFNFFTLCVDPEVAAVFQEELKPLQLFLDTNFLFGILDLHNDPQVEVSNDLLAAIGRYKLPFELCYHPETLAEMQRTLGFQADALRSREQWPRALSRVYAESRPDISGLVLKYHRTNAMTPMDVQSFLMPYEHVELLLEARGIVRADVDGVDSRTCSEVAAEYSRYLAQRSKEKPEQSVSHDAALLCEARQLRAAGGDSLSAGTLLMTCDFSLFGFDWWKARRDGSLPCAVMPHIFWQILRPFVPSNADFDDSFAQTFALPQFRTLGGGAARASAKLMSLLASMRDLPEEVARRLLANEPLLERLRTLRDSTSFEDEVESAIVLEQQALLEESEAKKRQAEKEYEEQRNLVTGLSESLDASKAEVEELRSALAALNQVPETTPEPSTPDSSPATEAGSGSNPEYGQLRRSAAVMPFLGGAIAVLVFEIVVHAVPIAWITEHSNSYSLQALFCVVLALGVYRLLRPILWSNWVYLAFLAPALLWLLSLLGGPRA